MPYTGYKTLKLIQDYYLSKVEIVERNGRKYILKSVPKFYDIQIKRQVYLSKKCKETLIPQIHWTRLIDKMVYFLMDYIESGKKIINDKVYIKTISTFHNETVNCTNKLFPVYNFSIFKKEFSKISKLLPKRIVKSLNIDIASYRFIFDMQNSIVHGDWVKAQLIGNKKYAILDFEMAFQGPSILDHAHFYMTNEKVGVNVLKMLNVSSDVFIKARIVETLRKLGWFLWFIESKFTNYRFEKEIKEHVIILERLIK